MSVNFKRGFFRAWLVLSLGWIAVTGGANTTPSRGISTGQVCRCRGNVGTRSPGGRTASISIPGTDNPQNIEVNQREHAWSAGSIPARNQWRQTIREKLEQCEDAVKAVTPTRVWQSLDDAHSLRMIFLPPFVLLAAGWIIGWIVKGFRTTA
jgi:hypothetical protein